MLCDACLATKSCRGSSTTTTTTTPRTIKKTTNSKTKRMSSNRSFCMALVFLAIVGLPVLMVSAVPYGRPHQRTLRLCSKGLSDALYLVCRDHGGFYEPFSYSSEDYVRGPSSPGLVEECCYRSCSYSQLEQYCKRSSNDKTPNDSQDGIAESLRIVNLPYASTRELATESRDGAAIESNEKIIKSKDRNCRKLMEQDRRNKKHGDGSQLGWKGIKIREAKKRSRTKGRAGGFDIPNKRHDDDDDYARAAALRVCRRRRRRRRRRHRGKALREGTIANVPEFKVGTTLPEPKDSMLLLFPSKTSLDFQRAYKDLANRHEYDDAEKLNSLGSDDLFHEEIKERSRRFTSNRS